MRFEFLVSNCYHSYFRGTHLLVESQWIFKMPFKHKFVLPDITPLVSGQLERALEESLAERWTHKRVAVLQVEEFWKSITIWWSYDINRWLPFLAHPELHYFVIHTIRQSVITQCSVRSVISGWQLIELFIPAASQSYLILSRKLINAVSLEINNVTVLCLLHNYFCNQIARKSCYLSRTKVHL